MLVVDGVGVRCVWMMEDRGYLLRSRVNTEKKHSYGNVSSMTLTPLFCACLQNLYARPKYLL